MTRSDEINELAQALSRAQGEIAGARKDSRNPHFNHAYADLASVWEACRAPLAKHGISVLQSPRVHFADQAVLVEVETLLMHTSGQWIADTLAVPVSKIDAQGVGSACTYARRYSLAAFVGVAPEDDDGNAATALPPARETTRREKVDRLPAALPETIETATVRVLGIVKRAIKDGTGEKFVITGNDQHTYHTFSLTDATTAKAAQEAGLPLEITFKTTKYGRDIQALKELEEPVL